MELKTTYFENTGKENTEEVFRIVKQRAEELGIKTIVVASTAGDTAVRATEVFSGFKIIAVTHNTGMRGPNTQEFTEENKKIVESKGGIVFTTTHLFSGLSAAMRKKFNTYIIGDIIANTLRIFGQGLKVVCEIRAQLRAVGRAVELVRGDEGNDAAVPQKPDALLIEEDKEVRSTRAHRETLP